MAKQARLNKGFSLRPASLPTRQRTSFYKEIIDEFIQSNETSMLVEGTDKKPVTLVQGLRKAVDTYDPKPPVVIIQRQDETYLAFGAEEDDSVQDDADLIPVGGR